MLNEECQNNNWSIIVHSHVDQTCLNQSGIPLNQKGTSLFPVIIKRLPALPLAENTPGTKKKKLMWPKKHIFALKQIAGKS